MRSRLSKLSKSKQKGEIQQRLLLITAFIVVAYALVLTLAPSIRIRSANGPFQFDHWLGVAGWGISFYLMHHQAKKYLPKLDPYLLPIIAFLSGIGLMTIWRLYPNLGLKQTIWLIISAVVVMAGMRYPSFLETLHKYKYVWLISGLLLTALTIFIGINPNSENGPTLWLQFLGIHFQPSELLKLLLIVFLAAYFTDRITIVQGRFESLLPTLVLTAAALLILFFQRDLGTASILLLIYLGILFTTRRSRLILIIAPLLMIASGIAGYFFLDVVRLRISTWLSPFSDPSGASYQVIQSMIAIAEGGLIGAGPGLGSPNLIPVSVSDFIFSAIAEELGFIGTTVLIALMIFLIYRGIKLANKTSNAFHRFLTLGIIFYFGVQSILIIGGNIGLLPLTGVTLPFVSYGGSSLLISFIAVLMLMTISHTAGTSENRAIIVRRRPRDLISGSVLMSILMLEVIVTSLLAFWFSPDLINRTENPRWIIDDRFVPRGNILDRDNQAIMTNTGAPGSYQRASNHIPLYTVIGYTNSVYGQTGLEASMYPYLRGNIGYPYLTNLWQELLYNQPPPGLDIRLTIDLEMQQTADSLLGENMGSIIVMNASSGEILAMSSHPYFNAETLDVEWDVLSTDEQAPLLNRATQGLYPAGAALFPFLAASQEDILEQNPDPESLLTNLNLSTCAIRPENTSLTWEVLIKNGCLAAQNDFAQEIEAEQISTLLHDLGFFSEPQINLNVAQVSDPGSTSIDVAQLREEAFSISPLQLSLAASALTHGGLVPNPRIVNAYRNPQNEWVTISDPQTAIQAIAPLAATRLTNLLKERDLPIWQVTAVTNADEENPVTWFMAGTTPNWQAQPISIVVVLEAVTPELAEQIGRELFQATFLSQN